MRLLLESAAAVGDLNAASFHIRSGDGGLCSRSSSRSGVRSIVRGRTPSSTYY